MKLTVNGDLLEVPDGCSTVAALLVHLRIETARVAVELNQDVVPRCTYVDTRVSEGDQVEIVTFVGGG